MVSHSKSKIHLHPIPKFTFFVKKTKNKKKFTLLFNSWKNNYLIMRKIKCSKYAYNLIYFIYWIKKIMYILKEYVLLTKKYQYISDIFFSFSHEYPTRYLISLFIICIYSFKLIRIDIYN